MAKTKVVRETAKWCRSEAKGKILHNLYKNSIIH